MKLTRSVEHSLIRRAVTFLPLLGGTVGGALGALHYPHSASQRAPWFALALACLVLSIILGFLEVVTASAAKQAKTDSAGATGSICKSRHDYGWLSLGIGADGFVSTSKTQAMMWTLGLGFSLTYLVGLVVFGATTVKTVPSAGGTTATTAPLAGGTTTTITTVQAVTDKDVLPSAGDQWDKYLILLGGPFGAAVLAKAIVTTKVGNGNVQSTANAAASADVQSAVPVISASGATAQKLPSAADIVTNNAGELDLVDTQYLIFNLVTFTYFAATFASNMVNGNYRLPDLPSTLLGLTSASALTYVGNKATMSSAPSIKSVVANAGKLTISGVNLVPASDTQDPTTQAKLTSVTITQVTAGVPVPVGSVVSATSVTATQLVADYVLPVPPPDHYTVRVITLARVSTDDFETKL